MNWFWQFCGIFHGREMKGCEKYSAFSRILNDSHVFVPVLKGFQRHVDNFLMFLRYVAVFERSEHASNADVVPSAALQWLQ